MERISNAGAEHAGAVPLIRSASYAVAVTSAYVYVLAFSAGDVTAQIRKSGPEFRANSLYVGSQHRPDVAYNARGKFTITWGGIFEEHHSHGFGIWARPYRRNGSSMSREFLATNTEEYDNWSEANAVIDCSATRRCSVAWIGELIGDGEINHVRAKIVVPSIAFAEPTSEISIRDDVSVQWVGIARSEIGTSMVVWHDAGPIFDLEPAVAVGRVFNDDRSVLTPPFPLASTTSDNRQPQVVALSTGDFLAVWWGRNASDDYNVYARHFDPTGRPKGSELQINSFEPGTQQRPAVAKADDGGFLAAWESASQAPRQGLDIYVRRFGPDGIPMGPEQRVNTFTTDSQVVPAVENDGVGGFVAAWVSYSSLDGPGQDGSGPGVFGRRLLADGTPDGLEFQLNATTLFAQGWPSWPIGLAADNGRVVAVWQDERRDTFDFGVFAQRLVVDPGTGPLCGDAHAQDLRLDTRDALQILRTAVGLRPCLLCLCDANGSQSIEVSDAHSVLQTIVGIDLASVCPVCSRGDESPAGMVGVGSPIEEFPEPAFHDDR